jgi:hypothetical protein
MTFKQIARFIGIMVASVLLATLTIALVEMSGLNVVRLAE